MGTLNKSAYISISQILKHKSRFWEVRNNFQILGCQVFIDKIQISNKMITVETGDYTHHHTFMSLSSSGPDLPTSPRKGLHASRLALFNIKSEIKSSLVLDRLPLISLIVTKFTFIIHIYFTRQSWVIFPDSSILLWWQEENI